MKKVDWEILHRTIEELYSLEELKKKLSENRPLRIKYGVDVTAPFLHIGHAVNLWMMRHLQECGHKVVFLIGDFTTKIGDPTGKSKTRKIIAPEEIERNAKEFIHQVSRVLLTDKEVFEIRRNSEWFDKMPLSEFLSLASMVTHSRLIQRDMFQRRIEAEQEIFLHEMVYPLLQGYDSVMLQSDMTIVGSDQLFNELMGRFFQERFQQSPQVIITTKITPGIDGKEKQSKSLGNYIALEDTARDKFGKVMSIPDSLIFPYGQVYTTLLLKDLVALQKECEAGSFHPMEAKKQVAEAIVARYHGDDVAREEREWFEKTFSQKEVPEDLQIISVAAPIDCIHFLQTCLPQESKSSLHRLILQGGVRVNGEKVESPAEVLKEEDVVKVGKRKWFKVKIV